MDSGDDNSARDEAQARLDLLQDIHKDFTRHLPTIEDAETRHFNAPVDRLRMQNDITVLRSDMSFLPYRLQNVQIERLSDDKLVQFTSKLTQLLDFCEQFLDEAILDIRQVSRLQNTAGHCLSLRTKSGPG